MGTVPARERGPIHMLRSTTLRLPPVVAVALLALHVAHDLSGFGGPGFDAFFAAWFQPVAFLGCGAMTLARAGTASRNRAPWLLLGGGLVFYAGGSVYYNLAFGSDATPPFPSLADALWLTFYPLALAGIVVLARRRLRDVGASVWLDGAIAGSVVAAVVAALVFQPVFEVTAGNGAAGLARLGSPVGDLISVGFVVAVWSLCGRRLEPFWALLGTGFALLAAADSVYVVQAAQGAWAPGGLLDLPYAAATMLLATAAWVAPRTGAPAPLEREPSHLLLATACGLTALGLVSYAVFVDLNPLATTLSLATLLAVVLRLRAALGRVHPPPVRLA